RPAPAKTSKARGLFHTSALASHQAASGVQARRGCAVSGRKCRRSVSVVAVRGIAISVIARIKTTVSAVKAGPESAANAPSERPAMKAAPKSLVKAAPESTAAKTAGLGSPSADRGSKRESNDRSRQQ